MPDTADADFLDRLDAAIGCQHCGGPLGESPSDDFCSPAHQRMWHEQHAEPLPWSDDAANVYVGRDGARVPLNEPGAQRNGFGADMSRAFVQAFTRPCSIEVCDRVVSTIGFTARCPEHEQEHQRANWRLQRLTGRWHQDLARLQVAESWASTDAQRAACRVRRQQLVDCRPRLSINVDTSAAMDQLRQMASALADSRRVTWRQPRPRGHHATWMAIDELYQHGFVTTDQPGFRGGRRPDRYSWTREVNGPDTVTVTYDEPYRTADTPEPPTAAERAIEARRNRNTGPPASRMDGRRGRGGPTR